MQANNIFWRIISRNPSLKRSYTGHGIQASYNDLPVPQGNWQTNYDAYQRKYNAQLAFGVLFLVGSIVLAKAGGFVNLNYYPPSQPGERDY